MIAVLVDWLPILGFFITYKVAGIYAATIALMIATLGQILISKYIMRKKIETINWAIFALVFIMGGLTLFFHNEDFIKWKPTILYLAFALAFLVTPMIKQEGLAQIMLANKIKISKKAWKKVNQYFIFFFAMMSALNTYILSNFSTETWVNFKLFGTLIITVLFMTFISFYLVKHKSNQ